MKQTPPRGALAERALIARLFPILIQSLMVVHALRGPIWSPTARGCHERSYLINGIDLPELWQ